MKILKKAVVSFLVLIVLISLAITLFVNFSPQFGQLPTGGKLEKLNSSPHFNGEIFENLMATSMDMSPKDFFSVLKEFIKSDQNREPSRPLPTSFDGKKLEYDSVANVTWFGHSAVLVVIDNKKILFDPMLGEASSPVPFLTKRFPYEQPIPIEDLSFIDFVVISHDHYDHLDMPTIVALKDQVGHFYTALGVDSHLISWGISEGKVTSLDWWESSQNASLLFVATPARHFSGRGLTDRNKTQWASWVVKGKHETIYFSGDGGYGDHFQEIGEKYGPFDFAMIECGQYNERWAQIHMTPEETAQAALDLKAMKSMPIHWGAFNLSLHAWTDPIERVKNAADKLDIVMVHPVIGKEFSIKETPMELWWHFDK